MRRQTQILLVQHNDLGLAHNLTAANLSRPRCGSIQNQHDYVCFCGQLLGSAHALHLDLVGARTQPRRIHNSQQLAAPDNTCIHPVTRGAWRSGHDGSLLMGQGIQQRRLAHIRRPHQQDHPAVSTALGAFIALAQLLHTVCDSGQVFSNNRDRLRLDVLVSKIEISLDLHNTLQCGLPHPTNFITEPPARGAQGGSQIPSRPGLDHIEDRFGLQ